MYSWGPACLRVWTVTCETRKKQDIALLCLLKNTQRMACHYKTNPSACIPPVHQTLPVEQDTTQSGKGSYKKIYSTSWWGDLQFVPRLSTPWPSCWTQGKRRASTSLDVCKFSFLPPLWAGTWLERHILSPRAEVTFFFWESIYTVIWRKTNKITASQNSLHSHVLKHDVPWSIKRFYKSEAA